MPAWAQPGAATSLAAGPSLAVAGAGLRVIDWRGGELWAKPGSAVGCSWGLGLAVCSRHQLSLYSDDGELRWSQRLAFSAPPPTGFPAWLQGSVVVRGSASELRLLRAEPPQADTVFAVPGDGPGRADPLEALTHVAVHPLEDRFAALSSTGAAHVFSA